ncbi:MAG: glucose 1-dehydrogenase [Acidimicrobiia bacterium]|nr:glucose 1-dehydrogenase [Acidimicrobiia bacterium]
MTGLTEDKIVLVTGSGGGIGRAAAELFAAEGAVVVGADVDLDGGAQTVDSITGAGGQATFVAADLTDEVQVEALVRGIIAEHGRLDAAFNNAGINDESRPFTELDQRDWDRMIAVNLTSVFLCMKHELAHMAERGQGAIVNTSSGAGLTPAPGMPHYTAAKHGVLGLTKAASAEFAGQGIRVNAVLPGMTRTPMIEGWFESNPEIAKYVLRSLPGGKLGEPEQVARAAVWLCSDQADWVGGVSLVVDGGGLNH